MDKFYIWENFLAANNVQSPDHLPVLCSEMDNVQSFNAVFVFSQAKGQLILTWSN